MKGPWKPRIEIFGPRSASVKKWVLVDRNGLIRCTFNGLAMDQSQKELARRIADLLNMHEEMVP